MNHSAVQSLRSRAVQLPVMNQKTRSHLAERFQMHVNRPRPQFTSARIGDVTGTRSSQHCAQKYNGRAHLLHQRFRNGICPQILHLQRHCMFRNAAAAAQMRQNAAGGKNVRQSGTIFQNSSAVTKQRACQNRQRTVFGTM